VLLQSRIFDLLKSHVFWFLSDTVEPEGGELVVFQIA